MTTQKRERERGTQRMIFVSMIDIRYKPHE